MSNHKFVTKNGWLTIYSLVCGYIECTEKDGIRFTMSLDGVYHVRAHDHKEGHRICWDCYDTLLEARKAYSNLLKLYKAKRKLNS